MILPFLSLIFFLFWEAFFAFSEIAFISAEKQLVERKSVPSFLKRIYLSLWENPERLLTTTILGITLSITGNAVITSSLFITRFGYTGLLVSSILLPLSMVIFGQILPKVFGKLLANSVVFYTTFAVYLISFIFYPAFWLNQKLSRLILKGKEHKTSLFLPKFKEVFIHFLNYEKEIDFIEKKLMKEIVIFSKKKVSEVMIPVSKVKALPVEAKIKDLLNFLKKYNFSFVPLYEGEISNIKLVIKVNQILGKELLNQEVPLKEFAFTPLFVPEVLYASKVLSIMQEKGTEFAVVVDEYGGVTGIITIEDLIEEVLGEFRDTLDYYVPEFKKLSKDTIICDASIEIEKLWSLGIRIPKGGYETLAGFLSFIAGKIPQKGEIIKYKNYEFKILKATPRKIEEVVIKIKKSKQ